MDHKRFSKRTAFKGLVLLTVFAMLASPVSAATLSRQNQGCKWYDLLCWLRGGDTPTTPTPQPAATPALVSTPSWTPTPLPAATASQPQATPTSQWATTPVQLIPADAQFALPNGYTLQLPKAMAEGVNLQGFADLISLVTDQRFGMISMANKTMRITAGNVWGALSWTSWDLEDPQAIGWKLNLKPYVGDNSQYFGVVVQQWQVQGGGGSPWPSGWEFQITAALMRRSMFWDTTNGGLAYHNDYPKLAADWLQTHSLWTYAMGDEVWAKKGQTFKFTVKTSKVAFFHWPYAAYKGSYGTHDDQPLGWLEAGTVVQGVPVCGVFMHSHGDACDVFLKVDKPGLAPWQAFFVSVEDILADGSTVPPEFRPPEPTAAPEPTSPDEYSGPVDPKEDCPTGVG
jgi:hypothetical protein